MIEKNPSNRSVMRICLISTELFERGMYGGFGAATRGVAQGLVDRGHEVFILMNRRPGQKPVEVTENGVTVISYPGSPYLNVLRARRFAPLFQWVDADIYHSEEPSVGTYLARLGAPGKKHAVTFRDPRRIDEHRNEWMEEGLRGFELRRREWRFRFSYAFIKHAARRAHGQYAAAKVVIPRAQKIYHLKRAPVFLPTPVAVPNRVMVKAAEPTVCFLGRWDPRKRPEMFFQLAERFPQVRFIAMGACQPHFQQRDQKLREEFGRLPNLSMPGVVLGEDKSRILEESWVLVNTSWREGLPISFIEAAAHQCAILSPLNPDDFARRFGYWAEKDTLDDLAHGLSCLLSEDRWRERGQEARAYVQKTFAFDRAIDLHTAAYQELLSQ
jgi:glycosyltransferase involved in cell wall biosynthesis